MDSPVFIVSSGRSGTYTLYKALSIAHERIYHEYKCEEIQRLGCKYYHSLVSIDEAIEQLLKLYPEPPFIDISNKASWLIKPLSIAFPNAKFIWLIRDGRKVCLSYYHKLADEHYDNKAVYNLVTFLLAKRRFINVRPQEPELNKRFWWPVPLGIDNKIKFVTNYDRWYRTCWHWNEVNKEIEREFLAKFNVLRKMKFNLEDLITFPSEFINLVGFCGLKYQPEMWNIIQERPWNVHEPVNYQMTKYQERVYRKICGETHTRLGYSWNEPMVVDYV